MFLKLRPHLQKTVVSRICDKLAADYYGPYRILERIGAVAYKLKLPDGAKVHPVFHVSLLEKAVGNYQVEEELPDNLEGDFPETFEPDMVLATRVIKQGTEDVGQVLVQWQGKGPEEATWEDIMTIKNQFPHHILGDKAEVLGESIDRPAANNVGPKDRPITWRVYTRRVKRDPEA